MKHRSIRHTAVIAAMVAVASGCGAEAEARAAPAFPADSASAAPVPAVAGRVAAPDSLRALYVNGWAAGSRSRMRELIRIADETEINAFVIDIKESDTYLTYDSTAIPLAREIGAHTRPGSRWLPALIDTLRAHRIYPIARIVVFKDRMLAEKKPELAIRSTGGGVWKDAGGKPWVNPYHRTVWDYNVAIAREALDMGFQEVQWDYVRFPDVNETLRRQMVFPTANGKTRADNIRDFIRYSREQLRRYDAPITADVFGLATHLEGDVGIGQNWERMIAVTDRVLPMVYPSHYAAGMYGFQRPNAHPYEIVRISMQDAAERTARVRQGGAKVGEVVPWLQAFTADYLRDGNRYGAAQLRQQIQATYDAGLKSWVLWNPGSNYAVYRPAFRPASGGPSPLERGGWRPTRWEVPRGRMSPVLRRATARPDSARRSTPTTPRRPAPAAPKRPE